MKLLKPLLLVVGLALPLAASAQWQWVDKDGRKVFSDRPPPDDIPAKSILKEPRGRAPAVPPTSAAAAASPAASAAPVAAKPASAAASAPKVSGKDKELEERKKQAEAQEAAKAKAEEERIAKEKAATCDRAKRNLQALNSGERIRQPNAKGELEFMTDATRAAEIKRVQDIVSGDCKS